jgi:DNA primase
MSQPYIDFAFIKAHASFARVIAGYNLKMLGTGSQRTILCPFHRERKPSCKINLEKGAFHCFGCEAKGNVLEFVARLEGDAGDLRAAAIKIAALCSIATAPPRKGAGEKSPAAEHRRKGAEPRGAAQDGAQTAAENGRGEVRRPAGIAPASVKPARRAPVVADREPVNPPLTFALKLDPQHPYLAERGLSAEQVSLFGLGLCNRGVMGGRICIPIHDELGQLVAYAGRWPGDELPDEEEKYKLPKHFQKSRVLFNLHRVEDAEHVVLVEGYWSAIRLHALGIPVVALMGNSVSPEQIALLRERGTRFVTLLLDGDDAGRQARDRALPDLANAFFVSAPLLPENEKPDEIEETHLLDLVRSPLG